MSREDLLPLKGTVTKVHAGGNFVVTTEEGLEVKARLAGRMRRFKIKVVLGDHVDLGVTPYDPSRGIITYRHK